MGPTEREGAMLAELLNDFRYRLRALIRGADLDREMEAEIEAHLEREAEALERQGLPAAEARRQARLAFGGLEGLKERSRDQRGTRRLEDAAPHRQRAFFDAVEERVRQTPGVLFAGSIDAVPLGASVSGIGILTEGKPDQPGQGASAQYRVVTPGYFKTLGVPFIAGRDFASSDARLALPLIRWYPQQPMPPEFGRPQAAPIAVVNESMARRFWPDGAIGRRFKVLFSPWITVGGVVADMHTVSLRTTTGPEFYLTALQEPQSSMSLLVRTTGAPLDLAPAVRTAIAGVDPALPIASVRTLEAIVDDVFGRPRFMSALLGSFAGIAVLLMTVGVYGLLAFTTAQRMPEIGVRVALGATRQQIHTLVLRDAALMTGVGVLLGLLAALALGRFIADQLYGVTPTDPATLVAVTLLVIVVVGLASWRPARRAGRIDPILVLRHD